MRRLTLVAATAAFVLALAPLARAAELSSQVEGFEYQRGFYTESDLGFFLRFGGWVDKKTGLVVNAGDQRAKPVIVSNLQPYIGFSVGYDLLPFLSLQLSYGTGFVAGAAPRKGQSESPIDHSLTVLNLAVVGNWLVFDRFALEGRVFGGGALFVPGPLPTASMFAGDAGAGVGFKYLTLLPGFIIGMDVNFLATFPEFIPALTFSPLIIKYVF